MRCSKERLVYTFKKSVLAQKKRPFWVKDLHLDSLNRWIKISYFEGLFVSQMFLCCLVPKWTLSILQKLNLRVFIGCWVTAILLQLSSLFEVMRDWDALSLCGAHNKVGRAWNKCTGKVRRLILWGLMVGVLWYGGTTGVCCKDALNDCCFSVFC